MQGCPVLIHFPAEAMTSFTRTDTVICWVGICTTYVLVQFLRKIFPMNFLGQSENINPRVPNRRFTCMHTFATFFSFIQSYSILTDAKSLQFSWQGNIYTYTIACGSIQMPPFLYSPQRSHLFACGAVDRSWSLSLGSWFLLKQRLPWIKINSRWLHEQVHFVFFNTVWK